MNGLESSLNVKLIAAAILIGITISIGALSSAPTTARFLADGPPDVNPHRATVRFSLDSPPRFVLRSAGSTIALSERGLFLDGHLACSWPGGVFDAENQANMVLGYLRASYGVADYVGCPEGLPIKSTWGDGGHGAAVLFLEIVSRRGTTVGAMFDGSVFYGDVEQSVAAAPPSAVVGAKLAKDAFRELHASVTVRPFLRDIRMCVQSTRPTACFGKFVRHGIYLPEANIGNGILSPDQFTEALATATAADGKPLIDHLRACVSATPMALSGTALDLVTSDGWLCGFEEVNGAWRLTQFFQTDYGE